MPRIHKGRDEGTAKVPNVPGGIYRHQNMHWAAFVSCQTTLCVLRRRNPKGKPQMPDIAWCRTLVAGVHIHTEGAKATGLRASKTQPSTVARWFRHLFGIRCPDRTPRSLTAPLRGHIDRPHRNPPTTNADTMCNQVANRKPSSRCTTGSGRPPLGCDHAIAALQPAGPHVTLAA